MLGQDMTPLYLQPQSYSLSDTMGTARTSQVVEVIPKLIEAGYGDRILLSQDVCIKVHLKRYGGNGYAFIFERVLPVLRNRGVTEEQINKLMVDNPRRILTFVEPQ